MKVSITQHNGEAINVNWPEGFPIPCSTELLEFNGQSYRVRNVGYGLEGFQPGTSKWYNVDTVKPICIVVEKA